jgi:hypothetical protein
MIAILMLLSVRLQAHFENVQRIFDLTTSPFAMHYLWSWIMEELEILHLTERLLQGKGGRFQRADTEVEARHLGED